MPRPIYSPLFYSALANEGGSIKLEQESLVAAVILSDEPVRLLIALQFAQNANKRELTNCYVSYDQGPPPFLQMKATRPQSSKNSSRQTRPELFPKLVD